MFRGSDKLRCYWQRREIWDEAFRGNRPYPMVAASLLLAAALIINLVREFTSQEWISEQTFNTTIDKILQTVRNDILRTLERYNETDEGRNQINANFGWIRTNIMLYNSKTDQLEIDQFACRMDGDVDRWLRLSANKGVAWKVFNEQKSGYHVLNRYIHPEFQLGQFNFTQEDWKAVNPRMHWIISVPLIISEQNGTSSTTFGVLNIDSNIRINVPDASNSELMQNLLLIAQTYGKSLALILRGRDLKHYRGRTIVSHEHSN